MLKLLNWARGAMAMLCEKASQNKDTGLYADVVLDSVPQGVNVADFVQYLQREDWFEMLKQFHPNVAHYQGWFAQFREDLLSAYEEMQRPIDGTEPGAEHVEH